MPNETTETETYEYDGKGLLTTRTYVNGSKSQTETYEYDDGGLMTKRTVVTVDA